MTQLFVGLFELEVDVLSMDSNVHLGVYKTDLINFAIVGPVFVYMMSVTDRLSNKKVLQAVKSVDASGFTTQQCGL